MNKQVQVSVEDLLDTLNAVQEDNVKTSTGIASRPAKETDNDGGVLSFFRDMFANSQAKAAEAREAIQPEMYRLAQESAYEVSEARKLAGITQSLTEGGGEIGRKPLPEGTTLRPVAKPPMTSMRDVTDTDEGKLDNEQPLRDLSDAVANEQIPSTQLEPTAKDEADEVINSLVTQLTTARLSAGEVTEEAAPVTAEAETTEPTTGGLMSRRLDTKGNALPITELRNYTDSYAKVYLTEHEGLKPHKSLEGGKDTAALGVKFSLGLKRKDYNSDEQFAAAVALKHRDKAKAKFGAAKWDKLPDSVKFAMTDLNYNTGTIGSSGKKEDATSAMKNTLDFVGMTTKAGEKASLISLAKRRAWNWNKAASDIGESKIAKIKQIPTDDGGTKFEYLDSDGGVIHSTTTSRKPVKLNKSGTATTLTTTRELDM
jgi:hypothetical protein